jgi:hypothetical protein
MTQQMRPDEPTNSQRALWAKAALAAFTAETYAGDHPDTMHPGDLEGAIADLICDLLHLVRYHPRMDALALLARAMTLYRQETAEEAICNCAERGWYGEYHDTQCPLSAQPSADAMPSAHELVDALECLLMSLSPRKVRSVLKAAGYSTDIWLAAHRRAQALVKRCKR